MEMGVWRKTCGIWRGEYAWRIECVVWRMSCGVWRVECGKESMEDGLVVWRMACGVALSQREAYRERSVGNGVCDMANCVCVHVELGY